MLKNVSGAGFRPNRTFSQSFVQYDDEFRFAMYFFFFFVLPLKLCISSAFRVNEMRLKRNLNRRFLGPLNFEETVPLCVYVYVHTYRYVCWNVITKNA